jgi:hypothetical protein
LPDLANKNEEGSTAKFEFKLNNFEIVSKNLLRINMAML